MKKTIEILKELLSNEHILYINLRNAHWNAIGIDFLSTHKFLESLYETSANDIDGIAERIKMCGAITPADYNTYLVNCTLTNKPFNGFNSFQIFSKLFDDYVESTTILELHLTENAGDLDLATESFLTTMLEIKQKTIWFLKASIS